ncbi:MAG: DNA-protecting protein DprA [Erysipelothrix sp.]|nr:DNA-protecting protein DprA [Erysipelothrix sp.]
MKRRLLYYTIKYKADYTKISKAIMNNEPFKNIESTCQYITICDADYPDRLRELVKPPYVLFYKGNIEILNDAAVSIVGSRDAIDYAIEKTKSCIMNMNDDIVIVSGLAKGIDATAHQTALQSNRKTIAVLGCGIDYIYPYSNRDLYHTICTSFNGLVISEFYGDLKPKPYYFPYRNRIIAALGEKLYVMQASLRSGTLHTVNEALELNREIYVLPYRTNDEFGIGCNYLIQQGANIIFDN